MLLPVLKARLGTLIPARLEGGLLYTDAHLARIKARTATRSCGSLYSTDAHSSGRILLQQPRSHRLRSCQLFPRAALLQPPLPHMHL